MNSPSSRLLKIPSSLSTPNLLSLEHKFSLSKSYNDDDDTSYHLPSPLTNTLPSTLEQAVAIASISTPNLLTCSLSNSSDGASYHHHHPPSTNTASTTVSSPTPSTPPKSRSVLPLPSPLTLHPPPSPSRIRSGSSAPASLQSSPRGRRDTSDFVVPATAEAVDRPRTLPPKSAAELQKHIKEYEEISKQIKKAVDKEAKENQKKETLKSSREKKLIELRKVWVEDILPQWEKNNSTQRSPDRSHRLSLRKDAKKVQEIWRVGLPPSVRGPVWKLAIGNELMITKELFDISIGHAQQTKETMFGSPQSQLRLPQGFDGATPMKGKRGATFMPVPIDELLGKEGTVALVSILDLPEDFPARELFVPEGPMHKQMAQVLEAYVAYRPDVGYAPCMSYLVAGLLLNMEALDTFICLANFINKPFNLAFYITDRSQMYKYTTTADAIILALLPKVHKRFKEVNIEPENYLTEWFMTLYLKSLPLDIASRVWDVYFLEGELFLFKVALALLKMYSYQFESYPRDLCLNILNKFPSDMSEEALFENIGHFNIDPKKFQKLLDT